MLDFLKAKPGDGVQNENQLDKVVPLNFFDDTPLWRAFILYSMFVFDGVLDATKLHQNLQKLAHKEAWWKLGARLRQNKNGDLEYHIPAEFTEERPAISFSHVEFDESAAEHPVACRLPQPSAQPVIVVDPDEFHDLMKPEGGPTKLADYFNTDRPQLGLHVVSFTDITMVSLYWPHTLMDAMGKSALLNSWISMLQGRENEVPDPYGTVFDPLADLGTNVTEPHKLAMHRMGTFGLLRYGFNQLPSFFHKLENRMVCIPHTFITKLHSEALADLTTISPNQTSQVPFLTEGDVLVAWWTRLATAHLPLTSPPQTIVLNNAYNLRKVLQPEIIPLNASYISNAIGFINVLLSLNDLREKSLGFIASSIRRAIAELGTREQVEAFFEMTRESKMKLPPFFGGGNAHMVTFSNWTKAGLFEVDFSAAMKESGGVGSGGGKPRYIQNCQFGFTMPNGFPIIGKDGDGNYWISGYLGVEVWKGLGEMLGKLTELSNPAPEMPTSYAPTNTHLIQEESGLNGRNDKATAEHAFCFLHPFP
ncbi:hypothetical protein DM02DRAFT_693028 [Periconia macrospinosa]|uniref:LysR family regulatory protein n=1 Tax=Periconia macrospinosa TaxID=97972 RepID=A0A2V1D8K5_9PLEO|nr:hypothetical protein DM02DRAFT_693028 [Periconia macrospinosa]